jgi:glycosyltransferase involved in cell wall biosynthesis
VSLTVVIPAFNEARVIPETLRQLSVYLGGTDWDWDILVVDDGSSDGTAAIVDEVAKQDRRVAVLREPHRGKGGAVKAGMLAARGEYRFLCDADLSMPPHELPRFLPPALGEADVAIGSREGAGAKRVGEPWLRHATGRIFNLAIRWIVIDGIPDTQCGFKMFTAAAAAAVFRDVTLEGWAFDVEALAIARHRGLRVVAVPIEWHYRHTSKVSLFRDAWEMLQDLFRIRAKWPRVR